MEGIIPNQAFLSDAIFGAYSENGRLFRSPLRKWRLTMKNKSVIQLLTLIFCLMPLAAPLAADELSQIILTEMPSPFDSLTVSSDWMPCDYNLDEVPEVSFVHADNWNLLF